MDNHLAIRWMLLTGFTIFVTDMTDFQLRQARRGCRAAAYRARTEGRSGETWESWVRVYETELDRRYNAVRAGTRTEMICCCGVIFDQQEANQVRYRRIACGC